MLEQREVQVHLLPDLVPLERLNGSIAVVIDVLRASTTIVHALASGCKCVMPCAEVEEAKELAGTMRFDESLLGGERNAHPPAGFDLGNSPGEYTPERCKDTTLVLTTTNGTRALLHAKNAERILIAAFVNFSAVCEQLRRDKRPLQIICAGSCGGITLEDSLLAGALVNYLCEICEPSMNDSARLAWDCFENQGGMLLEAMQTSQGGALLHEHGFDQDIADAARIDRFHLVPELRRDPLRIEVTSFGIIDQHWVK